MARRLGRESCPQATTTAAVANSREIEHRPRCGVLRGAAALENFVIGRRRARHGAIAAFGEWLL